MPDFRFEELAQAQGYNVICGVDEAGRGSWAGPVVAGAVILDREKLTDNFLDNLDDSKKLKPARREELFEELRLCANIGIGQSDVIEIDKVNILKATLSAMARAVRNLNTHTDFVLVDGNVAPKLSCHSECIVRGDSLSMSIAAASIIAKVTRDRIMADLACAYPGYGWDRNVGYGTQKHREAIEKYGVTIQHRKSYKPIKKILGL